MCSFSYSCSVIGSLVNDRVIYRLTAKLTYFIHIIFHFHVHRSFPHSPMYIQLFMLCPSVVQDHWPAFKTVARAVWNKMSQTTTTTTTTTTASPNDDSMTEVTIYGHTFRLNMSDPAVAQWMEHYIDFLFYRDRLGGL